MTSTTCLPIAMPSKRKTHRIRVFSAGSPTGKTLLHQQYVYIVTCRSSGRSARLPWTANTHPLTLFARFKNEKIREPNAIAHLENIQIFFYWYAKKSKGKLGKRSTITTLLYQVGRFGCMYNRSYKDIVLDSTLDEVRNVSSLAP